MARGESNITWWSHIDPQAVPLPHGTEVATRYERCCSDKVIPQGSVGRVRQVLDNGDVEVRLVGWGTQRFRRSELSARKTGQLRYAVRRHAAWKALRQCAVVEAVVGSRAWGVEEMGSDTDVRGVFVLPFEWSSALVKTPLDLVSADGSCSYWEIGKLIEQALRADPNTLELLFVDSVHSCDEMGSWLLDTREAFVSQEIYRSFGRYALSQLKKLQQSLRLHEHRQRITQWLREDTQLTLDGVAHKLAEVSALDIPKQADRQLRAKRYVQQLYRSLFDQGLLEQRDFASLVRFAHERDSPAELPREMRPKNAYNLLRLIDSASCWLRDGKPRLRVTGAWRQRLLSIKHGHVSLEEVVQEAETMMTTLAEARRISPLPTKPDRARADKLLRRIRHEAARRHLAGVAGPFGKDAPTLALAGQLGTEQHLP